MPVNKKVIALAHEVCTDMGIECCEAHHLRGRQYGEQLGAINDILLIGVLPLPHGDHVRAHFVDKRGVLAGYLQCQSKEFIINLVLAAYEQTERILTRGYWKDL